MAWAILAAIPPALLLLCLISLWLVRFRYHFAYASPAELRVGAGVRFLFWHREIEVDPVRAVWGGGADDDQEEWDSDDGLDPIPEPAGRDPQRGALRIPDFLSRRLIRWKDRARKAGRKWVLDPGVWRHLLRYGWRSGRRAFWLIHPRLESLRFDLSDPYALGRIAGTWSALSGAVPALACEVSYGFGAETAGIRVRGGGRFTALGVLALLLVSITNFPWRGLASRFAECWRDPRLARWQRRVLLP